jgi:uncharacterized membrane protein affecting hemolysin expression
MEASAHPLSLPTVRQPNVRMVVALLVAAIVALLISGALVYNSMDSQIEQLQAGQVAALGQGVQADAFSACVANHAARASVTSKCRQAAATFAANDPDSVALDKALAYIYPR